MATGGIETRRLPTKQEIREFTEPYEELMAEAERLEAEIREEFGLWPDEPEQEQGPQFTKSMQARFGYVEENEDEALDRAFGVTAARPLTYEGEELDRVFGVTTRTLSEDERLDRAFCVGEFASEVESLDRQIRSLSTPKPPLPTPYPGDLLLA